MANSLTYRDDGALNLTLNHLPHEKYAIKGSGRSLRCKYIPTALFYSEDSETREKSPQSEAEAEARQGPARERHKVSLRVSMRSGASPTRHQLAQPNNTPLRSRPRRLTARILVRLLLFTFFRRIMDIAHLFRSRLRHDLHEIHANADPGIHVHVAGEDMRKLCLQLCPETGPWTRLRLHFTVEFPSNWVRLSP